MKTKPSPRSALAIVPAILAAAALLSLTGSAQSLNLVLDSLATGSTVSTTLNGDPGAKQLENSYLLNFNIGQGFCVEPTSLIYFNTPYTYEIQDPSTLSYSDSIGRLVGAYQSSAQDSVAATAVQLAIWEVITDGPSGSLTSGNFQAFYEASTAPGSIELAQSYLDHLSTYTPAAFNYLTSGNSQDMVTWGAVPEPSAVFLSVVGMAGIVLRRRRA